MSFFSALTVPGLQQHLSFSREDSAILKGYGILFMIFHHVFGLYALPAGVDTAWIAPQLTKAAPIFKICVPIFIFITGYAMGWKTNSSPTFGSLIKTGFSHYFKFWKIYFLCLLLAILVSWAFPLPILPSVADMGWKNGLLVVTGLRPCYPDWWYMALFAAATMALYPICAWITHHIAPVPSMAALLGVSLLFQSTAHIPSLPGIAYSFPPFLPCFILGYMCAFLASRLSALSISQSLGAILLLALEILSIHLFSFSKAKTLTVIFLFTPLVSALDNPETPPHTALDAAGNLFRTYVAESQIHFRLPLQLGPLWNPKHQRSIHRDAGLLPSAGHGHAKTF